MTPLFQCLTQRQKKVGFPRQKKKYKRYIALKFYYLLYIFSWVFAGERSMKSRVFHFFFHHQLMMFTSIMALLLKLRISFLFFLGLYPQSGDEYIYVRMLLMLLKKGKAKGVIIKRDLTRGQKITASASNWPYLLTYDGNSVTLLYF